MQAQTPPQVAQTSAKDVIQNTIDEIIKIVEANPGNENKKPRRAKIRTLIEPVFDFRETAKRSLGPYWNKCSAEQRDEFVKVFADLLARTYLSKVELVRTGMVKVSNEIKKGTTITIKTKVDYKGQPFPLDYRMWQAENQWKVFDVQIENVGMVETYRNEFQGDVRGGKIDSLIEKLKKKTQDLAAKEEQKESS